MGDIEGYAGRLRGHIGDTPGLGAAASGLVGAASGLAGGSFARRIQESDTESSEEDFRTEVRERLDLMDERLVRLEDEMRGLREGGEVPGDLEGPGSGPDPYSNR